MCTTWEDDVSPQWQYASGDVNNYSIIVHMGTNRKEDSPVKPARRVIEVMLTGCVGVFKGIDDVANAHSDNNPNK